MGRRLVERPILIGKLPVSHAGQAPRAGSKLIEPLNKMPHGQPPLTV